MAMNKFTFVWICIIFIGSTQALKLRSYVSENGLHGTFTFEEVHNEIVITTDLNTTLEYPNQVWSWFISEFPVDYTTLTDRCCDNCLGKNLINLDSLFGYLFLPENGTTKFQSNALKIDGSNGLYGKSILLRNEETQRRVCASIVMLEKTNEKIAVATFNAPIFGSIYFRWFSTRNNENNMVITSDLQYVTLPKYIDKSVKFTQHPWKIYVTDILDYSHDGSQENCDILQLVFNARNTSDSTERTGDIDQRLGPLKIYNQRKHKMLFQDDKLILLPNDLAGPQRRLYLVLFDSKHTNSFLACAKIRYEHPISSKVLIQSRGIIGDVSLVQATKFEPTFVRFNLTTAKGDVETKLVYSLTVAGYKIHELPAQPAKTLGLTKNACLTTKFVFNPTKKDLVTPPEGYGTQDQYLLGDLSGKLLGRNNETSLEQGTQELKGTFWDVFLPLQGPHSVIHRSLVIYKKNGFSSNATKEPWICGSLMLYEANLKHQKQMFTAQAVFRYPNVGRMLFRQAKNEPWADTTILVEYLVHADGTTLNNSLDHRWAIHELAPGRDFYNWSNRCLSSGKMFDPYKIHVENVTEECSLDNIGLCQMGDLSTRQGFIEIAGRIAEREISRKLLTDSLLRLTGTNNIIGKSLVLYDDHGPKARGERLACSIIGGLYRRKAVVRDWFANGNELTIKGKIEWFQQSEYDVTNVEVGLDGLSDNSGYHIHVASVEESLQFPCESSSLYGHWNPLQVDPASSPKTYRGTPDQYEVGDLSGKFGSLDNHTLYKTDYNDSMVSLFGPRSIMGRSLVIHKKFKNRRWACATIEQGYSPSEARELRAIASFHHPAGYAFGYLKMKQLIYNDGSASDTIIEVNLRHPGKHDRNITKDHNWAIYVNPVGVDAAVKTQATRCVAGGYVWNPFFTQLADPLNHELYNQECGPENPLRCHVGDLSARLGTIDIGLQRKLFSDPNFPLGGEETALGRSIVILSPNRNNARYACANIEPDHDIIKFVNVEKSPRFVVAQFIEDIRHVMGIPEWFLTVDTRKTKPLYYNACVQVLVHFKGPIAQKLEHDFNVLLTTGKLASPSLSIPGYFDEKRKTKLGYKQCGVRDPNEKSSKKTSFFQRSSKGNVIRLNCYLFVVLYFIVNKIN